MVPGLRLGWHVEPWVALGGVWSVWVNVGPYKPIKATSVPQGTIRHHQPNMNPIQVNMKTSQANSG